MFSSTNLSFFFSIKRFFLHRSGFAFVFPLFFFFVFFPWPIAACFVADSLRQVVVSSTIDFFVGFRVYNSDDKVQYDRVIKSNHVRKYTIDLES